MFAAIDAEAERARIGYWETEFELGMAEGETFALGQAVELALRP